MPTADIPKVESAIVEMTNVIRKGHNLSEVKPDPQLAAAARSYARFLAQSRLFSHTADGRQPTDRVKAIGYESCIVSENLASNLDSRGFESRQLAREAVEGWMDSPGHRKNILTGHVVDIGVGVAKVSGEERYISVQMFGRPRSLAYTFRVNNASGQIVRYKFLDNAHEIPPRHLLRHAACVPGEITFNRPGAEAGIMGRYEARDGAVFVLRHSGDGGVRIDVLTDADVSR